MFVLSIKKKTQLKQTKVIAVHEQLQQQQKEEKNTKDRKKGKEKHSTQTPPINSCEKISVRHPCTTVYVCRTSNQFNTDSLIITLYKSEKSQMHHSLQVLLEYSKQ